MSETTRTNKRDNVEVNSVIIQGKIVHKFKTDKATILTISTGVATRDISFPKVVFLGANKNLPDEYEVDQYVRVEGNIQSSFGANYNKNLTPQSVFGSGISKATTQFEEDYGDPGSFAPCINHFKVSGYITNVSILSKKMISLVIKTTGNGHISYVNMILFCKNAVDIVMKIVPGTFVRTYGRIQTSKRTIRGQVRHSETVIASELQ